MRIIRLSLRRCVKIKATTMYARARNGGTDRGEDRVTILIRAIVSFGIRTCECAGLGFKDNGLSFFVRSPPAIRTFRYCRVFGKLVGLLQTVTRNRIGSGSLYCRCGQMQWELTSDARTDNSHPTSTHLSSQLIAVLKARENCPLDNTSLRTH